ncbi:MAG TPA: hypothetical protein PLP19_04390 [bacterium]|nr:hypothetical protein [bacterium]HPN42709.1 hypothetical protein [bacterium]
MMKTSPFLMCIIFLITSACKKDEPVKPKAAQPDIIDIIAGDMIPPHQGTPHGIPSTYDWYSGPRLGMGNNPGAFKAMIAWGQVYEDAQGNPAGNTRVHLQQIRTYILSKTQHTWQTADSSTNIDGNAYVEDFSGDANKPADERSEPEGGISVTAGDGYNFHFWSSNGRKSINPNDIGGVITMVRARLVLDDTTLVDDRATARYLLSVGGDYWSTLTAPWDNFKTNGDIGIGKFKYVTKDWQWFCMTTLTEAELRDNPPPVGE